MIFTLTYKEERKAEDWIKEHEKTCPYTHKKNNILGLREHYYYKFIPNSIGNIVYVGCVYCEENKNITDTGNW